ncbi:MAG: T9SS type A sorting domain-containing protein [candidate division Zixibacteria bacterium]|nr:T9SS type A sorting domain-containing protein [candidate division Zixibacteria bacterium]
MSRWPKNVFRVSLLLLLVWCVFGMSHSYCFAYQMSSPAENDTIPWQVLNGGGAMWLETASYKLSSSLGQSITGIQDGPTKNVYTGFWNPRIIQMTPVEWEEVDQAELPKEFGLRQNYPNPFNPTTVIQYALPKASFVKIQIYNILGQKVRSLVDEPQEPGYKTIRWDGEDDGGNEVSSGVYFYRIEAADFVKCRKMVLLK